MAIRITDVSRIPNQAPGIYFREVDLTVVTRNVAGFSAAAVGLTEKGPAFEITNSSTYEDRAFRLGELNPKYPTSYYAKQYLEQAKNYKEIRILGLEGYEDTVGFGIAYAISGSVAAVPGTSPLAIGTGALAVVLKKRATTVTGRAAVTLVTVATASYTDPVTENAVTAATDYLFTLNITYADASTESIICSLRPESKEYIGKKFGTDPLTKPQVKGKVASLWVDFIVPSVKSRIVATGTPSYYAPGSSVAANTLPLLTGNIAFGTNVTLQSAVISDVTTGVDVELEVASDITAWLANNDYVVISGITGTGNITQANGIWKVTSVAFGAGVTTFKLNDPDTGDLLVIAGATTYGGGGAVAEYANPTWEREILDFADVPFQTPITPWFVSDGDVNGDYKRLFRFWSVSDGTSANTETKIEVKNINASGYNGKGSFDIVVRKWSDREDTESVRLESFLNLTMDPTSDNYILRRIGNGEDFPLRSRFIFIEMNTDEELSDDLLPWGCLGYPNTTGTKFQDISWTLDYVKTQPSTKQSLGLTNNVINTYKAVAPAQLAFKNTNAVVGKGFHINPTDNATFASAQAAVFNFAPSSKYLSSTGGSISDLEKTKRNKFVVYFYGGFDGWNVYSTRKWDDPSSKDYEALEMALNVLKDKESLDTDFTVLVTPDIYLDSHASAAELTLDMIKERGDALYIPDFSYDETADVNQAVDLLDNSNLKSNSVALYFPWLQIEDQINKVNKWLPPSLLALGTIANVATNENVWQPPGGSLRTVSNNLVRTRKRLDGEARETLTRANINGITYFPGSGFEIAGVRTTQETSSALSFVHNRLLLCYAKKVLNQVLRPLLFQMNGEITKDAFLNTVRPIFDRIKKLNGVEEYKVDVIDRPELNDRTTLYGIIEIVPLYPIERIVIDFVLKDSSVSFNQ